jgi:hypothetical protein
MTMRVPERSSTMTRLIAPCEAAAAPLPLPLAASPLPLRAVAEDVADDLRDLLGLGELQLVEEDLLARGRRVELLDELLEPADARALVGDDEQVADDVDAALLALEGVEDVADVLGLAVLDADQLGDEAVAVRRVLVVAVERQRAVLGVGRSRRS